MPRLRSPFLRLGAWWKAARPANMQEVASVQQLVDALAGAAAAEQTVVLEFYGASWAVLLPAPAVCRSAVPLPGGRQSASSACAGTRGRGGPLTSQSHPNTHISRACLQPPGAAAAARCTRA